MVGDMSHTDQALYHRAGCSRAARHGKYKAKMEN
jgi:hypothetical protein